MQSEINQQYVGKEEDERIMKVIEDIESETDYFYGIEIKELFGMNVVTKTYLED